jgi:hypothetical protein
MHINHPNISPINQNDTQCMLQMLFHQTTNISFTLKTLIKNLLVGHYICKLFIDISCRTLRASLIWRLAPELRISLHNMIDHQRIIFTMFVTFIFITDTRHGLGWVGSKLFYDGLEMWIVSIYDRFVKLSRGLICDVL